MLFHVFLILFFFRFDNYVSIQSQQMPPLGPPHMCNDKDNTDVGAADADAY
jgi:hypothetical protein